MYTIWLEKYINDEKLKNILTKKEMTLSFYNEQINISLNWDFWIWSSTYRAFRWLNEQPSKIFKAWASKIIIEGDFKNQILWCKNREDFKNLHNKLWIELSNFRLQQQKQKLILAHKNKLLDLFFKYLARSNIWNVDINKKIIKYSNIPLDSKTLPIINDLLNWILLNDSFSMWVIKTKESYEYLQELVYIIMTENDSFGLNLDYYANNI
jgi:hypothetical protein